MTVRTLLLATVLLAMAGCGAETSHRFQLGTVEFVDEVGIVTAAVAIDPPAADAYAHAPTVINPDGKLDRAVLLWVGSSCSPSTRVILSGNALSLTIVEAVPGEDCGGTVVMHAIQMDLDRVVDVSSIHLEEQAPSPGS